MPYGPFMTHMFFVLPGLHAKSCSILKNWVFFFSYATGDCKRHGFKLVGFFTVYCEFWQDFSLYVVLVSPLAVIDFLKCALMLHADFACEKCLA